MCIVCPSWLSFILYNPIRKAFTDRNKVLKESGIAHGSVVLEVGAGNGFFTEVLAKRARKVYAVELQGGMVKKLKKRVAHFGDRVTILQCDIAACGIEDNSADACLMYYSFHEVKNKAVAAGSISGALKKGGLLSIYEPSIEVNKKEMRKTAEMFENIGFRKEAERHGLFTRFVRLRKIAA
ncbi:MAG: class I SAM-dependent methyltransferase [Nitrospirae bacterium]|nr:class I SAM-dependent methyltransferase [Nitrospirota bacterium]MCL5421020.1 class I SAM-dependent methyltransferase [Nitrospirota bacterium]